MERTWRSVPLMARTSQSALASPERESAMRSHKEPVALSGEAALLVIRLIEKPSKRTENAARRWAKRSPTHMLEILKTLCTVKNLDIINQLANLPSSSPRTSSIKIANELLHARWR
jgi:hypothetical protein